MTGQVLGPLFGQEDLSLAARLARVFYAPRDSFASVVGRESALDWLIPLLLACAVGLAVHQLTLDLVTNPQTPAVQRQLQQMAPEEQVQYEKTLQLLRTHGWMMIPIGLFFSLVTTAWIILLLVRFLFRAKVTYRQMLVVKAYASMIAIPEWLVRALSIAITGDSEVYTGPGAWVGEALAKTYAGRVLMAINLFDLWQLWVMGVGLGAMAQIPVRRTLLALLALWGIWIAAGPLISP